MISGFETSDPSLVFAAHHMNAWEEEGDVVFDLSTASWDAMETFFDIVDYFKQHLVKKDLETSSEDKTWFRPSHYPGEVFFIPNPGKSIK